MRPRTHQGRSGEGFPAVTKHPGTPKEEGRWREKRERKKERKKKRNQRKKERKRDRERREKEKAGVPSYEQSSRATPKKERGDPESSIQENPKKQGKKGEGRGRRGD